MILKDKTVIVTGAGSGIGEALVESLINKGANIIGVDLNKDNLASLKKRPFYNNENLITYSLDISNKSDIDKFAIDILKTIKNIDGIINCAGIIQPFVKIKDLEYKDIDKVMDVNFYGTLYMVKTFLSTLIKRPEAFIVNVSSMGGFLPVPGQGVYGASKAAVKLFTESLYAELIDTNIKVSVVFPGATDTNISTNSKVNIPNISDRSTQKYSMASPQDVASKIVKGIEKEKPQIFTGKDSKFMNRLYRINPVFATKFIAKRMRSLLS